MHMLTVGFVNSVKALAKKDGYASALNSLEVLVLGAFIVSEVYLGLSRDKTFASSVLDEFHHYGAESLFRSNLPSYKIQFPAEDVDTIHDQFASWFYDKTKERYAEYRSIMLGENGLWRDSSMGHLLDLRKHLITASTSIEGEPQELMTLPFIMAVVDHLARCNKSLKH